MTDFHLLIKDWYRQNKRDLPWRETKDPYKIWLSEVILQQTRVDQGMNYYHKFTQNYPLISDLAAAPEEQILRDWQGLGYYSRARNMHATSREVMKNYKGKFPEHFEEIRSLKGIGDYTAAAISSFAFDLPHAVVDGNVYRVLSRVFDIDTPIDTSEGKRIFHELANQLLDKNDPATHNQAIMELGAIQCKPLNPGCEICPLQTICQSFKNKTTSSRPVKSKRTKVRDRFFHFFIFDVENKVVLEKRTKKDIWQHLYQFPLLETSSETAHNVILESVQLVPFKTSKRITHILSHQRIHATFYHFNRLPENFKIENQVNKDDLTEFALPRLIDRYLEEYGW